MFSKRACAEKREDMSGSFDEKIEHKGSFDYEREYNRGLGILPELGIHVCVNSREPERFHADAVTKGNYIFLSRGAEVLLRHEMGHVIQQNRGEMPATSCREGESLNESASLEREADRLGSRIPPQAVRGALSAAREGASLGDVRGVVQCFRSEGDKQVEQAAEDIKRMSDALNGIPVSAKTQAQRKSLEADIAAAVDKLRAMLLYFYPGTDPGFIDSLVTQVQRGSYRKLTVPLYNHLYLGLPIDSAAPAAAAPSKPKPGKVKPIKRLKTGAPDEVTGLHAYSDIFDGKGKLTGTGTLPKGIIPLGYIGDPNQVHILHWRTEKSEDTKFSTMMSRSMREGISKLWFETASAQNAASVGGIAMGKAGETRFPTGDDILLRIPRGAVLGRKCEDPEKPISLGDIFFAFNPDKHPAELERAMPALIDTGIYQPA